MKNEIITRYDLEEQRQEIRKFLVDYINECAKRRVELILQGDINEVLVAIKGEISMAAMEGRIDLSRNLSEKFEELACVEVDLDRIAVRDAEDNYLKR